MFDKAAERMSDNIVKSGLADNDDKELYLFGIQQGLFLLMNIGTTIVIGLLSDTLNHFYGCNNCPEKLFRRVSC